MATQQQISDFLESVEKRAFKRASFHLRNDDNALDVVQDSMMKLVEHYAHKPTAELPMLFQRILSNNILDWFRRNRSRQAVFLDTPTPPLDSDLPQLDAVEDMLSASESQASETPESLSQRAQTLRIIEREIEELPARQREAFLLRYWEEMDIAETAAAMGCSEGSVKTHCSRAVKFLATALLNKGIKP
ncbi:MAG: RNA polymerase sigma factor [Rhodoferax sp.]|nr:RNA polymerase sigma factor [Rhodoferax sp.]